MNAARRFLIPFPRPVDPLPAPSQPFDMEDTVYDHPRPEHVFQPARKSFSIPGAVSTKLCAAGVTVAFLAGVAAARLIHVSPARPVVPTVQASVPALQLPVVANAATEPVTPRTAARLRKYRFTLNESKLFQRVGPLALRLNKADHRRQTFTLTLQMKDKHVQFQDRALAEPIRLRPSGEGPSEILIQRIEPDQVHGVIRLQMQ